MHSLHFILEFITCHIVSNRIILALKIRDFNLYILAIISKINSLFRIIFLSFHTDIQTCIFNKIYICIKSEYLTSSDIFHFCTNDNANHHLY